MDDSDDVIYLDIYLSFLLTYIDVGNMVVMIVEGIPDEVVVVKQENIGVTDRMDVVVEIVIIVGLGILIMIMFQVRPLKLLMMMEEEREVDHIVVLTEREGITQSIAAPSIDESIVHRNESMRMVSNTILRSNIIIIVVSCT